MKQTPFTPGFFHFLLGFSAIILLSFGVLLYLTGATGSEGEDIVQPTSATPTPSSQ